jgi:hypothetical protein
MANDLIMWAGLLLGLPAAVVLAVLVIAGHDLVRHFLLRMSATSAAIGLVAQAYRNWIYISTGVSPSDVETVLWFAKDVALYLAAGWVVLQTWRCALASVRRTAVRLPPPPQYDPDDVAFARPARRRPAGLDVPAVPAVPKPPAPRPRAAALVPTPSTRARTGARTRPAPLEPEPPKPRSTTKRRSAT